MSRLAILSMRHYEEQKNRSDMQFMTHLSSKRLKKVTLLSMHPTGKVFAIKFKEQLYDNSFTCSAKTEQVPTIHVERTEFMPICNENKELI